MTRVFLVHFVTLSVTAVYGPWYDDSSMNVKYLRNSSKWQKVVAFRLAILNTTQSLLCKPYRK